ncbi:hypothetical protein HZA33_03550 [Candidatus Pacearchaeota archaeon]|nr:hypothetical protein [Candidatus Pacearchaeota archaeon]
MAQNLENKLDDKARKEILKDWVYLAAAQDPNEKITINSQGKNQELGLTYSYMALRKLKDSAKSQKEKFELGALLNAYEADMEKDGSITPKSGTNAAIGSLMQGYLLALTQSPVSEVTSLAKEMGYKEKFPEFLANYKGTYEQFAKDAKKKIESTDEKAKVRGEAMAQALNFLTDMVTTNARDRLRDYVIAQNFEALEEKYKDPEKVLKARKEKAEKEKKANGGEED